MAHLLGAEALHLEYPTRVVFDGVTLGLQEGDRVGIVGRNGDGKSTLLRLLAGRLEPDSGRVTRRRGIRLGMLDQADVLDPELTVAAAIVAGRAEHEWAGDARVRDVLAGLVADIPWEGRIGELSGGQRRRVALAALLVQDWDVVFLDEPTNHLDVEGIAWLARHLKSRWPASAGGLVVVTHDRWFLDEVCTATWEVHDRIVEPFEGGYAAYILQRVERDRMAAASEARRQNLARKELAWLRRGAPARTSKPKFRIDAANALISDVPEIRDPVSLQRLAVSRLGKDVVDLIDVSVAFPRRPAADSPQAGTPLVDSPQAGTSLVDSPQANGDLRPRSLVDSPQANGDLRPVLRDITWRIAPGERTGILGVNGAGKSTLLGLISGAVQPTSGRVKRGATVKVATLTQRLDELDDVQDQPVRMVIAGLRSSYTLGTGSKAQELTPSQLLERLGFSSAQLSTPVKDLSGGQKRRLQLLLILLEEPNVLILDEPTNDLDTDMLAAIEDLLDSWPGTLIVVSHDRYLIERVTDQQFAIIDGHLRHLPGGVDEYLQLRSAEQASSSAAGKATATSAATVRAAASVSASASRHGAADPARAGQGGSEGPAAAAAGEMALSGAERRNAEKELGSIDRRLERLQADIARVHEELAAHDQSDYVGLGELTERLRALEDQVADLETRWLELSELLEA
ncbi:ABC-F family ATP-binding cassette domain-containing protein [Gryllotalpicola ginsengisoli]|uniref:ABC-F family ATP-binding cassette domain-containing protein n=1 Tax=Gryllotalpicola ginsengisoli TaxID=444608 RepID=UPI000409FE0F|nr:ABC-F family ATP-binding cassette domain-containing protein [Gryllotalpicola ginsengisoli]